MTRGDDTVKILQDVTRISGTSPFLLSAIVMIFILITREHGEVDVWELSIGLLELPFVIGHKVLADRHGLFEGGSSDL
jgi:hypothetical protein